MSGATTPCRYRNKAIADLAELTRQKANPFCPAPAGRDWTKFAIRMVASIAVAEIAVAVAFVFVR